ncbi:MAG: hypothetical protein NTY64_06200, partial [Deltaproteobacteria bacterium]|nr:hypothetical protein [Deltaproteobacteria bacterium]
MRFTFVAAAYHPSTPHSGGFARRVPRNAGELFTKPSLWRLFTRSSTICSGHWNIWISDFSILLLGSGYA